MIGLDADVLVRYLVADDAAQHERARRLLEDECSVESPGLVNAVVLCELVWVLSRAYSYKRDRIAAALSLLLAADEILVEDASEANQALAIYQSGEADFADALIGLRNRALGCVATATFDKELESSSLFRSL